MVRKMNSPVKKSNIHDREETCRRSYYDIMAERHWGLDLSNSNREELHVVLKSYYVQKETGEMSRELRAEENIIEK